jgi:hypothetical protein
MSPYHCRWTIDGRVQRTDWVKRRNVQLFRNDEIDCTFGQTAASWYSHQNVFPSIKGSDSICDWRICGTDWFRLCLQFLIHSLGRIPFVVPINDENFRDIHFGKWNQHTILTSKQCFGTKLYHKSSLNDIWPTISFDHLVFYSSTIQPYLEELALLTQ